MPGPRGVEAAPPNNGKKEKFTQPQTGAAA